MWAIPTGNSFAEKLGSPVKAQALRGSAPALTPAALEYTAAVQAVASPTVSHEEKVYVAMEGTVASFELVNKLRGPNGQYLNYIRDKSDCNIDLRVTCGPVPCPTAYWYTQSRELRPVGPLCAATAVRGSQCSQYAVIQWLYEQAAVQPQRPIAPPVPLRAQRCGLGWYSPPPIVGESDGLQA